MNKYKLPLVMISILSISLKSPIQRNFVMQKKQESVKVTINPAFSKHVKCLTVKRTEPSSLIFLNAGDVKFSFLKANTTALLENSDFLRLIIQIGTAEFSSNKSKKECLYLASGLFFRSDQKNFGTIANNNQEVTDKKSQNKVYLTKEDDENDNYLVVNVDSKIIRSKDFELLAQEDVVYELRKLDGSAVSLLEDGNPTYFTISKDKSYALIDASQFNCVKVNDDNIDVEKTIEAESNLEEKDGEKFISADINPNYFNIIMGSIDSNSNRFVLTPESASKLKLFEKYAVRFISWSDHWKNPKISQTFAKSLVLKIGTVSVSFSRSSAFCSSESLYLASKFMIICESKDFCQIISQNGQALKYYDTKADKQNDNYLVVYLNSKIVTDKDYQHCIANKDTVYEIRKKDGSMFSIFKNGRRTRFKIEGLGRCYNYAVIELSSIKGEL